MNIEGDREFLVYMHISPNGKVYVGLTSQKPEVRWGSGGIKYRRNKHFWSAVQIYGWDNFRHEIIASRLTLEEASNLEKQLIYHYQSVDPNRGYNHTNGGNWTQPTNEIREKLRKLTSNNWKNPEFRNKVVSGLTGHLTSDETKRKISLSKVGKKLNHPSPLKRRKWSEERKQKFRGRPAWNKGLTKETHLGIYLGSRKVTGLKRSAESIKLMIEQRHKFYSQHSSMWVHNGTEERLIFEYTPVPDGFVAGRLTSHKCYINKGGVCKFVDKSEVDTYLNDGWILGRGKDIGKSVREANQKYIWVLDNELEFNSAKAMANYLNNNGFPKIVSGTITSLYYKGFSKSPTYSELDGRISRREVHREN